MNVTCWTGKRVSPTCTAGSFYDRSANVLSVSYTVHIRFVRYTSVTRTFVDRSLLVTCSVRMRSLRLPRRSLLPLRQLPSPDKQFLHIFCPFGIRYLYPFRCDSTIRCDSRLKKMRFYRSTSTLYWSELNRILFGVV